MKRILLIFLIIIVLGFLFFLIRGSEDRWICVDGEWVKHGVPAKPEPLIGCGENYILEINNQRIYLAIADTDKKRQKGLSSRAELGKNQGMLFVFEEQGDYPFWMKQTLIPLDIIWINQNKEVVFIKKNAQPCSGENCPSIKPNQKARYVLEINAGKADELGLEIGDKLLISRGSRSQTF